MRNVQNSPLRRGLRGILLLIAAVTALGLLGAVLAPVARAWNDLGFEVVADPLGKVDILAAAPDGQGGTLLAFVDDGASTLKVGLQRIDHGGTTVWHPFGQDFVVLPIELGASGMDGPVAVCDDGAGGAFCAYRQFNGGAHLLYVAHVLADGSVAWSMPVGNYQFDNTPVLVAIEPTGDGNAVVVHSRGNGNPDAEIVATYVGSDATLGWSTTIWSDSDTNPDNFLFTTASTGNGEVFVGVNHDPYLALHEKRALRIAADGTNLWGDRGVQVFTGIGLLADVVPDGQNGLHVCNDESYGSARVQHLDQYGAATWTAGGVQVLNVATGGYPGTAAFCADGFGGLFAVAGVQDLWGQRVDINGNKQWGASGLQLTTLAGWQEHPTLAHDGFGGLLVAYRDHYFSELTDPHARALSARRYDHWGTLLWENPGFFWTMSANQTGREPWNPQIFADGSGGAHVAWLHWNDGYTWNEVYAAGLGHDGSSPPRPDVLALRPDGAASGDVLGVSIVGDYLAPSQGFVLRRSGSTDIPVTGLAGTGGREVTGTLDLTGAADGAWDMVASILSAEMDTLVDAFGVGDPTPCAGDGPLIAPDHVPLYAGSRRKVAFASDGVPHYVTITYNSGTNTYQVFQGDENLHGAGAGEVYQSADHLSQAACATGPVGDVHMVFVRDSGGVEILVYLLLEADHSFYSHELPVTDGVRHPVVAVDSTGTAHVVFESDIMGESWLFTTTAGRSGFGGQSDLMSGAGSRDPDLCRSAGGLMLTYTRNSWIPGWREICYQRFDGSSWGTPTGFYSGWQIYSPSIAWDGANDLLMAFVLDNTGSAPLLHTARLSSGTLQPVRWRLSPVDQTVGCAVSASGPRTFFLLTEETAGGSPGEEILLRMGDGDVFGAPRLLNSHADVHSGYLAADPARANVFAYWVDYDETASPFSRYKCLNIPTNAPDAPFAPSALAVQPNPFNPATEISFGLARGGHVKLEVFDMRGRLVRTLLDEARGPGEHRIPWDGRDAGERPAAAGLYLARLRAGGRDQVQKMVLVK